MSSANTSGGIGVFGLLGVAFVVLKLAGIISWSWWLVLLPFYGGFVIAILIFVVWLFSQAMSNTRHYGGRK